MNPDLNHLLKRVTGKAGQEEETIEPVTFAPTSALTEKELDELPFLQQIAARLRRRMALLIVMALVLFLLIVVFCANYSSLKLWRAHSLARSALSNLNQQKLEKADSDMHAAYLLEQDDPEVLRTVARILTLEKDHQALIFWERLLATKAARPEDRRNAAAVALQDGNDVEARPLIKELLREEPENPQNLLLAARLMAFIHRTPEAMALAREALIFDPYFSSATIFLAGIELEDPLHHSEGIDRLFELSSSNDPYGLLALEKLAVVPDLTPEQVEHVVMRLRNHPLAEEANKIMALALEIKNKPDQRNALLQEAVADHQNSDTATKRQFCVWLNSIGEHERVLTLLPLATALTNLDYFLIYVDTLAEMKRWSDLQNILVRDKVPLPPAYVDLYLSRCATELGDDGASDTHWREAQIQASTSPSQSLYLANYAERMRQTNRAIEMYQTLIQTSTTARTAYGALLRLSSNKDTQTLRDLLDQVLIHFPKDEAIRNDDAYFNLLLGDHVPEMNKTAEALVQENGFSLPHRTVLALARLRLHEPSKAMRVYDHVSTDWSTAPTSALVVYASVLLANGYPAFSRSTAAYLHGHILRPEEQALLDKP